MPPFTPPSSLLPSESKYDHKQVRVHLSVQIYLCPASGVDYLHRFRSIRLRCFCDWSHSDHDDCHWTRKQKAFRISSDSPQRGHNLPEEEGRIRSARGGLNEQEGCSSSTSSSSYAVACGHSCNDRRSFALITINVWIRRKRHNDNKFEKKEMWQPRVGDNPKGWVKSIGIW